ncbi:MAG: O-antigen ligase domain-containing protein [Chloroflexi bacterium]|nr:MAG: O-antigen ligase domain-containing protein [Chloroflexota bacterium]
MAFLAFSATVILMPFRLRVAQWPRQVGTIWNDYTDFILFASDVAVLITISLWGIAKIVSKKRIDMGPALITWPLVALSFIGLFSVIVSVDRALSFYHVVRFALLFGLYLYIVNEIKSTDRIIKPISIMIAIQAPVALLQFQTQSDIGLQFLGEYSLDPNWSGISIVNVNGERWLRAYGLSDHPNILGGILAFGLLFLAGWFVQSERRGRLVVLPIFSAGALALITTYSRAAWLAFAGGIIVILLLTLKTNRKALWQFGWFALATVVLALPLRNSIFEPLGSRLGSDNAFAEVPSENASLEERAYLNNISTEIFFENGLLGVGLGSTPQAIQIIYPEFPTYYQPGHVALLNAATDIGILGATFFGILIVGPWLVLFFSKRLKRGPFLIATSAMLMGTAIVGLFDYYTWFLIPGRLAQWIVWGMWGSAYLTEINTANIQEATA